MPAARAVQVDQPHIHKVGGALVLERVWHGLRLEAAMLPASASKAIKQGGAEGSVTPGW